MYELSLGQNQMITFVMVDANWLEVGGLAGGFTVQLSKAGAAFQASVGAKAEIGSGWYSYVISPGESDTPGPLSVRVTAPGCVQQNLEYVVLDRQIIAIEFTYTVTNSATLLPIEGVQCWFTTDAAGLDVVWAGITDTFGVARDGSGNLPRLDPGTYFIFRNKAGFSFVDPDTEIVS